MTRSSPLSLRKAALFMLVAMAMMGLVDNFVVEIAEVAGLWQFAATRSAMAIPMALAAGWLTGQAMLPKRVGPVAVRSFLLATVMVLYFGSIPMMPIALVVAGLFTSPAFVLIFSAVFFGKRIGPRRIFAVALGFLGVLLILGPGGEDFSWAVILPVIGGAFYALSAIVAREYCAEESTIAMLVGFFAILGLYGLIGLAVLGDAESTIFAARGWVPLSGTFLFWTFIQAVSSVCAVGLLTLAYQSSETSYLVVFEYALLVFASLWAYLLYDQTFGYLSAAGMVLIVLGGCFVALHPDRDTGRDGQGT